MFSKNFNRDKLFRLLSQKQTLSLEDVEEIILQNPTLESAAKLLLSGAVNKDVRELILAKVASLRRGIWNNRLYLMPPLYISDGNPQKSGCMDHCIYCPWRNGNVPKNQLVRLTAAEITKETEVILGMGYKDVELVAATDPELLHGRGAANAVYAAKSAGTRSVGINFFPLPKVEDYKEVHDAGCNFAIVWQETYDCHTYKSVHPKGPKSKMQYRLDAHDRACQGGIETAGVAFLGGLSSNWRYEALACMSHAEYLVKEYGCRIIFGMPRWKGQTYPSSFMPDPYAYDEEMYRFVGALYSWMIPGSLPWFSTREDFELSAKAAEGGGCLFTLTCSTVVGGYTRRGAAQFPVFSRGYNEGVVWLREKGFHPENTLP